MRALLPSLVLAAALTAQNTAVIPAIAATRPGNAAVSMPLRWSQGVMQVVVDHSLLPAAACTAGIQGIHLRRPAFLGESSYAALSRTLIVRAGVTTRAAQWLLPQIVANQPTGMQVVFGPGVVAVPATPALGHGDVLGPQFVHIPFAAPVVLATTADHLFLEFECTDGPLAVEPDNWVEAVQFVGGVDGGYAVPLGNGGCSSLSAPLELRWNGSSGPNRGSNATLQLTGAVPSALVLTLVSLDPANRAVGGSFLGFGADLSALGLTGCHQWAAPDLMLVGTATVVGSKAISFAIPTAHTVVGQRIVVQAAEFDAAANPMGIGFSNGTELVLDQSGVGNHAATVFFPGATTPTTSSPWGTSVGLMPVLAIDY